MSEIGLAEIFGMGEATGIIGTLFVTSILLEKANTKPVSRY